MERTTLTQSKRNNSMVQQRALALSVEGVAVALIAFYFTAITLDIVAIVSGLLILFVIINAISIFGSRKQVSNEIDWLRP
jgi:hypothetical protein